MTYNTNTDQIPCSCCSQRNFEGQWWFFSGYPTGYRLVSGYYCPKCASKVYEERKHGIRKNVFPSEVST
jgi:hypothetical protein